MKSTTRSLRLLSALLAATSATFGAFFGALPAAAVTIDSFTTNQATVSNPPGGATVATTAGADILGLRRALDAGLFPGGAGPVTTSVAAGVLTLAVTNTTPDSRGEAIVTWDGDATAGNLNVTGLASQNLTTGGHSALRIRVNSASAGSEIVVDVHTSATAASRGFLRVPVAIVAATDLYLSYAHDFVAIAASPADFTNVGAMQMRVRGTEVSVAIDSVDTLGPNVTASKRDLALDNNPIAGTIPEGSTFKYRITVGNTGGMSQGTDLADTVDANTTLNAATLRATPVAINDSYVTAGNVGRTVAAPGLLANDFDPDTAGSAPELVVAAGSVGTFATNLGGSITIAADGGFSYEPPAGVFKSIDTFTYTLQDNDAQTDTALVKVAIGPRVWFVDDAHPGTNVGTLANPFVGFTAGNVNGAGGAGDQDAAGDIIFLRSGNHAAAVELEASQWLIGEGDGLTIDGQVIVAAGTDPVLTSAGHGIVLASNNTVRGFTIGNTGASSFDIVGSNFGTLTASNIDLQGTGGALSLTNGALAATFDTVQSTSGTHGINLDTATGSLTVNGATSLSNLAFGLRVVASGTLNTTFSGTATISASAGTALLASTGGTLNFSGTSNTATSTGGPAVDLTSTSLGSGATFATASSSSSVGKGLNLDTVSGAFIANGGSILGPANIGVDINAGSSTITYAGSITSTAASRLLEVTARTGGTVTLSGNLSGTGASHTGINIAGNSGGTINLSGGTKTLNTSGNNAVTLATNTGATVNFTGGGLGITTTSGIGFNATGGAAGISVQGSGNSITSSTGMALNVASTAIAAAGLNFQSIVAGTGAGSAGVGISVVSSGLAGGNGGLVVTGSGSPGSGGTIQHKTGADNSTTAGIGIYLQDTKDAKFAWMQLNDFDNSAIVGRNVQGFELTNSVLNGTIGNSSAPTEGPIAFGVSNPGGTNGLQGTGLIRNTKISGGIEHNLEFYNQSGSMNLTIEGLGAVSEGANPNSSADDVADCIIEANSAAFGGDGIQVEMQNTATATIVVNRCLFRDNKSQAIQMAANNDSALTVTVNECKARKFTQGNEGMLLSNGTNGDLTAMVSNNSFSNFGGTSIFVGQTPGNASASSFLNASILSNIVNQPTSATNHGILAFMTSTVGETSQARVRIDGNTVVNDSTAGTVRGILVDTPDSNTQPSFQATVTNNSVAVGDNVAGVGGLVVQARQLSSACANIGSNTVTFPNGNPGVNGIRARQANTATMSLEGSGPCSGTAAAVLACRNPASTTEVLGTISTVGAGTCLLPSVP